MRLQRHTNWQREASEKLALMSLHALVNVCCSGNKEWSELAMEEYEKRKRNK